MQMVVYVAARDTREAERIAAALNSLGHVATRDEYHADAYLYADPARETRERRHHPYRRIVPAGIFACKQQ